MKKVEFPTFLNEQPTIIFGLNARQILVMICGIIGGYSLWSFITNLLSNLGWHIACAVLGACVFLLSIVVAMASIGAKPLEEWLFVWLFYAGMPKIYLYKPLMSGIEIPLPGKKKKSTQESEKKQKKRSENSYKLHDKDDLEED
jgi:PrgI family protein